MHVILLMAPLACDVSALGSIHLRIVEVIAPPGLGHNFESPHVGQLPEDVFSEFIIKALIPTDTQFENNHNTTHVAICFNVTYEQILLKA